MLRLARRFWPLLLILSLVGGTAVLAAPHLNAWHDLAAGRDAVEHFHAEESRRRLDACLTVWPDCIEARLLDARAARLAGDFNAAENQLREAERRQNPPSEALVREWAMFHVGYGDLDGDAADYLRNEIRRDPDVAPSAPAREALAEGEIRMYRVLDALNGLKEWLDLRPNEVQALKLRGDLYWQIGARLQSVDDYQRVVDLDPARQEIRERLAIGLIEKGRYEEALKQLAVVRQGKPNDPHIETSVARCYKWLDRPEEAQRILDGVLARRPDYGPDLLEHGRMLLQAGRPSDAEEQLRRAVQALPHDYEANFALADALEKEGKSSEAKTQNERAQRMKDRDARIVELTTRQMNLRPRDPALQCELGKLFLEGGDRTAGERWLLSALRLDPHYRPANEALVKFYEEEGDAEKAAFYREEAPKGSPG